MRTKLAIIAAVQQELAPLLRETDLHWTSLRGAVPALYGAWESERAIVACSGIGVTAAMTTAQAIIDRYNPELIVSAGFAGALTPDLKVGDIARPAMVVHSSTGARYPLPGGKGVLVTASIVAGVEGKRLLAREWQADTVDMEAAGVAAVAAQKNTAFVAVKAISDETDFELRETNQFIEPDGRFLVRRFAIHVALRPRLWAPARQLALHSRIASLQLRRELLNLISADTRDIVAGLAHLPTESKS